MARTKYTYKMGLRGHSPRGSVVLIPDQVKQCPEAYLEVVVPAKQLLTGYSRRALLLSTTELSVGVYPVKVL